MNILFHLTTAIPLVALVANTKGDNRRTGVRTVLVFGLGILMHGVLDIVPHCYPIPSEWDAVAGLLIMALLLWFSNRRFRLLLAFAFLGVLFPDLVDHSSDIINHRLGWQLPVWDNIFPWHWKTYSGSIYNQDCRLSTWYHLILITLVVMICWWRRPVLRVMFGR